MNNIEYIKKIVVDCFVGLGRFLFCTWQGRLVVVGTALAAGAYYNRARIASIFASVFRRQNNNHNQASSNNNNNNNNNYVPSNNIVPSRSNNNYVPSNNIVPSSSNNNNYVPSNNNAPSNNNNNNPTQNATGGSARVIENAVQLSVTSSTIPNDPDHELVEIAVHPRNAKVTTNAKGVNNAARIIFVVDTSGSMFNGGNKPDMTSENGQTISRIAAVVEGLKKFVGFARDNPRTDYSVSVVNFSDYAYHPVSGKTPQELGTWVDDPNITNHRLTRKWMEVSGTDINSAIEKLTEIIRDIPDNDKASTTVIMMTDGEDGNFEKYSMNHHQAIWEKKNVRVVSVGISNQHHANILRKIISKDSGELRQDWSYRYVSGETVAKDSQAYAQGKRTFAQVVEEVCQVGATTLRDLSISLSQDASVVGSSEKKNANQAFMLGSLNEVSKSIFVKVKKGTSLNISFKARTLDGKAVSADQSHTMNTRVDTPLVEKMLERITNSVLRDIIAQYTKDKTKTITHLQTLQVALTNIRDANLPESDLMKSLVARLQRVMGIINSNQAIPGDILATELASESMAFARVGSAGAPCDVQEDPAEVALVCDDDNTAYSTVGGSSAGGSSASPLTLVQEALKALFQGISLKDGASVKANGLVMDVRAIKIGEGDKTLQFPMGYNRLRLPKKKQILEFYPDKPNADGSITGVFTPHFEIGKFCQKYNMTFDLLLSKENQVTVDAATKKGMGLTENVTHFQQIYPAAVNPKFKQGCPFASDANSGEAHKKAQQKKLLEAMKKELTEVAFNLLTLGGFIYHAGYYHYEQDFYGTKERVDVYFDNVTKQWKHVDEDEHGVVYQGDPNNLTRGVAQIRVFNPNQVLPGQILPTGKMVAVPADVQQEIGKMATDPNCPYFQEVTFSALLEIGLQKYRWLNPGDPLIQKTKEFLMSNTQNMQERTTEYGPNGTFGRDGAWVYYSPDLKKCMMLPIASVEKAVENLQGKYFVTATESAATTAQYTLVQDTCAICLSEAPTIKFECGCSGDKPVVCDGCNTDLMAHSNLCKCPNCSVTYDPTKNIRVQAPTFNVRDIVAKRMPTLELSIGKVNHNYTTQDWLMTGIFNNNQFLSKKHAITQKIRDQIIGIPATCTQMAFIYPVYGKDLAVSYAAIGLAKDHVKRLNESGLAKDAAVMEGLYAIGGFAFFDSNGDVKSVYSILKDGTHKEAALKANINQGSSSGRNSIDAEYERLIERQKKKELSPTNVPDIGRITLPLFFDVAEYFSFTGDGFEYRSHSDTGKTKFKYSF